MPFEKRSKSFRQTTHDMLIKLKEIRESFSSNKQEKSNDARKITHEAISPLKSSIKRQKSCSLKDISSMSGIKDPECQSLKLESKTKSFNSVQTEVAAQIPVPNFAAQLKNSNLFNRQATLHNRRSLSVDHLSASNEFINSIKIEDDAPHSFPKPQKFPVLEDPVVVRKKTLPNAVRAKTLNCDISGLSQGRLNEIKGVSKIVIGDELCAKINRQERLVFEDNEIHIVGRSGQNKVLKEQVELRPGIQQLDKKNVVLHDVNNVPIQLYFDTSKDARCFVDSERLNSPLSEKSSIKTKLLRLLGKRSSREFLVEKGIYMNESIFGNTIQNIYQMHDCVPEFLTKSIQLIEMPSNISQVGIYRTSGNLATIQKIRFEVDKGNLSILDQYYEDVDVLTGALKLFFRELKEPLIPINVSEELLSSADKSPRSIDLIVRKLPKANYETLICLLRHLLNIIEHKETNKMDIYNMTICWGPSLMFVPDNCVDIMAQSSSNSKVLDLLLNHYKDHPKDLSRSLEQIDIKSRIEAKHWKEMEPLKGHKKSSSCSSINDVAYDVITKMVDLVEANAKTEGIYKKTGSQVKIDKISKKLAKNKLNELEKIKADIHDFAGALRKYINDLSEPLIPKEYFEECNCDNFNHNLVKQKLKKNVDTVKRKEVLTILLRHMVRILHEEKSNKTTLSDVCSYWRNVLIKTNQDDKTKTRLMEALLEVYGDYRATPSHVETHNPMPDVIKDIEAMARFSKYDNVHLSQQMRFASRGEAKILEEKTENDEKK
ncbi:uncharacterized protein LOC123319812 isoform X2 [Coccinella septempunctata]|uniref:uncharacterized protein LOC123319812 isoform X2 n=1 Tax=Coccinella septempunctata TaxID=41139 RepID=UPI001D076843|nr:uncharacterized protein LOC123319812 isoform X2 [Coccinella septempunctata]